MKKLILISLLSFSACSGIRVNVDLDSCEVRGEIDGIRIGNCEYIDVR